MAQATAVVNWFANVDTFRNITVTDGGGINSDNGNFTSDGAGNVTINGAVSGGQSATTPAIANAGTITTAGTRTARVTPASTVTGIIMQAGTVAGQEVTVSNNAAVGFNVQFDTDATSHVANGLNVIIPGLGSMKFVWDSVLLLWVSQSPRGIESPTAPVVAASGTIATAGLETSRVAPSAARAAIILAVGTYPGQRVTVINESAAANTVTFDVVANSHVADGVSSVIAGLNARTFVWDSIAGTWFPCK